MKLNLSLQGYVDDYLAKPFNLEEFLLRVKRLLTGVSWAGETGGGQPAGDQPHSYAFGGNRIDFDAFTADCRAGRITLTEQEAKLLKLFIANRGKSLTRKQLLKIGWGYIGIMNTRTVDNFIVRLRRYFADDPGSPFISGACAQWAISSITKTRHHNTSAPIELKPQEHARFSQAFGLDSRQRLPVYFVGETEHL